MPLTTYLQLDMEAYEIRIIKDLVITHKINEHSKMSLTAVINPDNKHNPVPETKPGAQVELLDYNKEIKTLFKGAVQTIQIKNLEGIYYLELEALSNTIFLDIKKNSRSFQDQSLSYKQMIKSILSKYPGSDFIDMATNGESIGHFTMQFEETDWEFFKRMASRFNAGLIVDVIFDKPKFTLGKPSGTDRGKIDKYNYSVKKDIVGFMKSSQNTNPTLKDLDKVNFYIQTSEEFNIGDQVSYLDIKLYVHSITIEIINGSLLYKYSLSTINGLSQDKIFNEKIIGLSLKGRVIDVLDDKVKVHLEIDNTQDKDTAWKFQYTTSYAAEGSSGWYCMPELEDTVYIYFPTKEEKNGVGINSSREQGKSGDKIHDPKIKYFRTADGKELKFSPDELLITCCNFVDKQTGEKEIIYIKLNEGLGIEIMSTKPISLNSDSNLTIESKKKILIKAKKEIKLKCKTSEIILDGSIDVAGKIVKIN